VGGLIMPTILDGLMNANYNLNKNNTGDLNIDNMTDSFGKETLKQIVKLIEQGASLDDEFVEED
jgi:ribosome recycling factor